MKNMKLVKIFALFILFSISSVLLTVKAQSQSNLQKLEGTKWKASASFPTPPDTWLWEFNYVIEENNKVRAHIVVAVHGRRQKLDYNMSTKSYELIYELTTVVEREQNEVGTYQQTGNSIKMKFPSHQIDAKLLDGNQMIGKITTYDGEKSVWAAEAISEKSTVTSKNKSDKVEKQSEGDGGAGLTTDLGSILAEDKENKFSAPADSPLIGTWKYVKYSEGLFVNSPPRVESSITLVYSQNGVVESIFQDSLTTSKGKGNWKYIPKDTSSGLVEEYIGNNVVERANVKWMNSNQFEYTVTFHSQNTNAVGNKFIFTRQ